MNMVLDNCITLIVKLTGYSIPVLAQCIGDAKRDLLIDIEGEWAGPLDIPQVSSTA
jgi:hypothetical protein